MLMNIQLIKNISYLSITVIFGGNSYDLSSGLSKNIKNLLPSFPYTFKFPIKENQRKINVTFTVINDTIKPFDYAKVNLYTLKKNQNHLLKSHIRQQMYPLEIINQNFLFTILCGEDIKI